MNRFCLFLLGMFFSVSVIAQDFTQVDDMHAGGEYAREYQILSDMLSSETQDTLTAEILWRLARVQMEIVDLQKRDGVDKKTLLEGYQAGMDFAARAIDHDPSLHLAYFWRSANTGKYGQVKGVLDSLDKARPMRDDLQKVISLNPRHGESWKVLGMLYSQVPGVISFGDKDAAVSLARKGADAREEADDFDNHYELAKILAARDWSAAKRNRSLNKKKDSFHRESNLLEKYMYYEGTLDFTVSPPYSYKPLSELNDREEAREILAWIENSLVKLADKKPGHIRLMQDVRAAMDEIAK